MENKMKKYKEYLDLYMKQEDFYPYKLVVAVEMNCYLEGENYYYDEEDFELMCEFVYEYYLDQDSYVQTIPLIAYELKKILFEDRLYDVKDIKTEWWAIEEEMNIRLGEFR